MAAEQKVFSFELWRQDDNGNCFLVGRYAERAAAEDRLAELTRVLHKQIYWIVEKEEDGHTMTESGDEEP